MSWNKTITVIFQKFKTDVVLTFEGDKEMNALQCVRIQSMFNEYFLVEEVYFSNRDNAYDFIKHYPISMAKAFLSREAIIENAI